MTKPFELTLTPQEKAEITNAVGAGGFQSLYDDIMAQLAEGNVVTLNDAQLGKLVRYMTQYGSGGFQGHLKRAFQRALIEQINS